MKDDWILPIMTGVPWVWKWEASSLPLLASSEPELTLRIFDVTWEDKE